MTDDEKIDILNGLPVKLQPNENLDVIIRVLAKVRPDREDLAAQVRGGLEFLPFPDTDDFDHERLPGLPPVRGRQE
jgi:hypothetical protein